MKKRIKLILALTVFCIVPVVSIGLITDKRLEKNYLSSLQSSQFSFLNSIKASLNDDLSEDKTAKRQERLASKVDAVFSLSGREGQGVLYLIDGLNNIVVEKRGQGDGEQILLDTFQQKFQADHGEWSVFVRENKKVRGLLSHIPLKQGDGYQLFTAFSGKIIEQELTTLRQKVAIYTLSAVVAVCAAAFMVYAYFISQSSVLRTFVQRFDRQKSPVPEVIPSGEFADVCQSFKNMVVQNRECEQELLEKLTTDPLTGAFNKVVISQKLEEEVDKAKRYETPLSFILFEVDRFARIIDRFGAETADQVLCRFTGILHNSLRSHDLVGRYGANQFLIILPLTDFKYCKNVADRIRSAVEVTFWGDPDLQVTVSGGACWLLEDVDILKQLSELTTLAKQKGRNRIETELLK